MVTSVVRAGADQDRSALGSLSDEALDDGRSRVCLTGARRTLDKRDGVDGTVVG